MAESLEYKALLECSNKLVIALKLDPASVADELAAKSVIPQEDVTQVITNSERARQLASSILVRVQLAPNRYYEILDILSKHKWLEDFVNILQTAHGRLQNTEPRQECCEHTIQATLSSEVQNESASHHTFSCDLDDIPHQKSSFKVSNPIVRFSDLDEDDREDLHAQMNELTKQIDLEFEKLLNKVFRSFRDSENVDRDSLVLTLVKKEGVFKEEELAEAKSIFDVFKTIKPYCSYFNYDIIEVLVEVNGLHLTKSYFKEYIQAFADYCKAMPCAEEICGSEDTRLRRTKLHFKLDFDRQQLKPDVVRSIKCKIAGHLGIKPSALYLCRIKDGCISLEFLIPEFILQSLFPLREEQKMALYQEVNTLAVNYQAFHLDIATEVKSLLAAKEGLPVTTKVHQASTPTNMFFPVDPKRFSRSCRSKSESEIFHPFIKSLRQISVLQKDDSQENVAQRICEKDQKIAELEAQLDDEREKGLVLEKMIQEMEQLAEERKTCMEELQKGCEELEQYLVNREKVHIQQVTAIYQQYQDRQSEMKRLQYENDMLRKKNKVHKDTIQAEEFPRSQHDFTDDLSFNLRHTTISTSSGYLSSSNSPESSSRSSRSRSRLSSIESFTDSDYSSMFRRNNRPSKPILPSNEHYRKLNHHLDYHLKSKSHLLNVETQARRSNSLTNAVVPETATPDTTSTGSINSLETYGDCSDHDHLPPKREKSLSADNIPALLLNDLPFPPLPLEDHRFVIKHSPKSATQRQGLFQKGSLRSTKPVKEKTSIYHSDHDHCYISPYMSFLSNETLV